MVKAEKERGSSTKVFQNVQLFESTNLAGGRKENTCKIFILLGAPW